MPHGRRRTGPSMNGATSSSAAGELTAESGSPTAPRCTYIPDLCAPVPVLGAVLSSELVAITLALARQDSWLSFLSDVGRTSLVLLWLSLTSVALLCVLRPTLARLGVRAGTALALAAVLGNVLLVSELLYWVSWEVSPPGALENWLPADHLFFAARNLAIGGIVLAAGLRYLYVAAQWRDNVRREAESRIHALQARIRPHFLFNSMNTIASLTRSNAVAAEQAVLDLADLFRASLADSRQRITLEQELEIARVYERMERQRLGDRLRVDWRVEGLPLGTSIPGLTLQPLLENAIYHGIERLAEPGVVDVEGRTADGMIYITVTNPVPAGNSPGRAGARMALANIHERLRLACGDRAGLTIEDTPGRYRVTLALPA
jgi:two-component system sensor histidine kinase AlgZ